MKKIHLFMVVMAALSLFSCNSTRRDVVTKSASIEGSWELDFITGPRISFQAMYPDKKPTINFDLKENFFAGNSSCNQYRGKLNLSNNTISFKGPIISTKMMCPNIQGETTYLKMLDKVETFSLSEDGKTLNFLMGEVVIMRYIKK
jgi:heat shock protein HslJ